MRRAMERPASHTPLARWLHWIVAIMLPMVAVLGWVGERAPDRTRGMALLHAHFGLGVLLAAMIVVRTVRRVVGSAPAPSLGLPGWQRRAATVVHFAMYLLLWFLPISGYVVWVWMGASMDVFGVFDLPRVFEPPAEDERGRAMAWYVHVWGGWALAGLVALHVVAVLWHAVVRRDGVLRRMTGAARTPAP